MKMKMLINEQDNNSSSKTMMKPVINANNMSVNASSSATCGQQQQYSVTLGAGPLWCS